MGLSPRSGSALGMEPAWDPLSPSALLAGSHVRALSLKKKRGGGAWVAQSVGHVTSAQIMIVWSVSLSPASGSMLTAQSLEPASDSVSPCLCQIGRASCRERVCLYV